MSSQKVQVSSSDQFGDSVNPACRGTRCNQLLSPAWDSGYSQGRTNKAKSTHGAQTKKGSQDDQVFFYKQKAHQSFMQVIQVQELHEQEIQQLKQEYENRIKSLQNQVQYKNQQINIYQRNTQHHLFQLQNTLQIQGLQLIQCKQANYTRFDESSILNFREILSEKQPDAKMQAMREKVISFITSQIVRNIAEPQLMNQNIIKQFNGVFQYVKEVAYQLTTKIDSYQALLRKYQQKDSDHKKIKFKFEAIQKDATLMSQNLRKINTEKTSLQKKIFKLQKQLKAQKNTKQAFQRISLKDNNNSDVYSSNKILGASQTSLLRSTTGRIKPFKSYRDSMQKNVQEAQQQEQFIQANKKKIVYFVQKNKRPDDESFDVQDLMNEMSKGNRRLSCGIVHQKIKTTQLIVNQSQQGKLRKKSFDN